MVLNTRLPFLIAGGAALIVSSAAIPAFSAAAGDDTQLETVVVTAQRRVENLQDVPTSAVVVSGEALAKQNEISLETLSRSLADVHINDDGPANDIYIRGIGSGGFESVDQSVALFTDDIYHGRSRTTSATFLDIERVEILKGPQSTFFGNNAIAGAVNVVTAKPTDQFETSVRALYGMYGQYATEGVVSGPITDKLDARAAVIINGGNGWLKNVTTGLDGPDTKNYAGRLTLLYRPTDDFDATIKVEGSDNRLTNGGYGGAPFQTINCPPPPGISPNAFGGVCATALALHSPIGLDNTLTDGIPGNKSSLSTFESVLTANYHAWNQTFSSVTGFNTYQFAEQVQALAVPVPLDTSNLPEDYRQFSQELRVASPTGQRIEYLAGIYYQHDHLNVLFENNYFELSPLIETIPPLAPLLPYLPIAQNTFFSQDENVYSIFGSVTWNITDKLRLDGGLRGTQVQKSFTQSVAYGTGTELYGGFVPLPAELQPIPAAFGIGVPGTIGGDRTDHAWMPSGKLSYRFEPQVMAYFSYADGFKAGGFNSDDTSGTVKGASYKPEHVNAYEIGLKSEWWDHRLLLNIDAFWSRYRDLQVSSQVESASGVSTTGIENAATSETKGVELEGQWLVVEGLRLSTSIAYDKARYIDYPNASAAVFGLTNAPQNLSGQPTEFAPDWSGNLVGTYTANLPGGYRLVGELGAYFSTLFYLHESDDPELAQGFWYRLDGRITFERPDSRWAVDFIGKNLNDRVILTNLGNPNAATREEPRNVAVQVRYRY
jgi:iron complex outermembrane recepter protein